MAGRVPDRLAARKQRGNNSHVDDAPVAMSSPRRRSSGAPEPAAGLWSALRHLLRPLVRLLLAHQVSYPLLSRLRREGLVATTWRESEAGPPRRYYRITESGRVALTRWARRAPNLANGRAVPSPARR